MDLAQHIKLINENGLVIDVLVVKDSATGDYRTLNSLFAFSSGGIFNHADEALKAVFNGLVRIPEGKMIREIYTGEAPEFLSHDLIERLFEEAKIALSDSAITG